MTTVARTPPGRLAQALRHARGPWRDADLEPLADTGLAHEHVRLLGHGALARIPKQSQMDLPAADNLRYQAACFERATPSGHTPRLLEVLPTSPDLPRGALVVEEIVGRAVRLPSELPAIAVALAALHRLPMPAAGFRSPLLSAADPLLDLLGDIERQAEFIGAAGLSPVAARTIADELARLHTCCERADRPPRCLISFDAHPGNFIVEAGGRAVLVDLEKCRYAHASLDLAHATLYTSTTWSAASAAVLSPDDVAAFYAHWARASGPSADDARRWHLPLRRAMWLWSITWCAKWRVESSRPATTAEGERWSSELSDPALVAQVRDRVDHYLDPTGIAFVRDEFAALELAFGAAGS